MAFAFFFNFSSSGLYLRCSCPFLDGSQIARYTHPCTLTIIPRCSYFWQQLTSYEFSTLPFNNKVECFVRDYRFHNLTNRISWALQRCFLSVSIRYFFWLCVLLYLFSVLFHFTSCDLFCFRYCLLCFVWFFSAYFYFM